MNRDKLSGFLLIDKPAGISSFDVIRQLRRQTGIRTFGHAGTLDPFATGLLVLAVNSFTRLLSLLDNADKTYEAIVELGKSSTTGDPEGEITIQQNIIPGEARLKELPQSVLGITSLSPPIHSAIKVNGQRAYKLARKQVIDILPERPARIYSFEILEYSYPALKYCCRVSKGTYIRSLSIWVADFLGTSGYTFSLRRTAIESILVEKAISPDEVTAETIGQHLMSVLDILPAFESIVLSDDDLLLIRQGRKILAPGSDMAQLVLLDANGICCGMGYRKDGFLFPKVNI